MASCTSKDLVLGLLVSIAVGQTAACGSSNSSSLQPGGDDGSVPASDGGTQIFVPQQEAGHPDADLGCVGAMCGDATISVCGNGVLEAGEMCDDGNSVPGDGCSGTCQIEASYSCPNVGQPCVYSLQRVCGDGKVEGDEACDDGNTTSGDGCSSTCEVEQGYSCGADGTCMPTHTAACGDGMVNAGEQCDDGNTTAGDGCSPTCKIEQGWTCPTPGKPCQTLEYCGDGVVQTDNGEQCDDGNLTPGDGCSASCQIEPGYACPAAGQPCVATWVCGNGHIDPGEACDDGNTTGGDGCSADCTILEPGYTCPNVTGSGGPCVLAPANVCGDGVVAGNEQCDDGNTDSGDGCSSTCAVEPG